MKKFLKTVTATALSVCLLLSAVITSSAKPWEPNREISRAAVHPMGIAGRLETAEAVKAADPFKMTSAFLEIDETLSVINSKGEKLTTAEEVLSSLKVIPFFHVDTKPEALAFAAFVKDKGSLDINVISSEAEYISLIRNENYTVRGILDMSKITDAELIEYRNRTNIAKCTAVIIPTALATRENCRYLQQRLISVWTYAEEETLSSAVSLYVSGINGVIVSDTEPFVLSMKVLGRTNVFTRHTFIIGHRGLPALYAENTVKGSRAAFEAGADMVENDVYLTTDGHVVVMHNAKIEDYTDGKGIVENLTLAEIQSHPITKDPTCHIPTLDEYFEMMKEFGDDKCLFIEIKSGKPEICQAIADCIKKYGMENRVCVISFSGAQVLKMQEVMPEISTGLLSGAGDLTTAVTNAQQHNSTWNPYYGTAQKDFYQNLNFRGLTAWPWTLTNFTLEKALLGTSGATVDNTPSISALLDRLEVPENLTFGGGEAMDCPHTFVTYDGKKSASFDTEAVEFKSRIFKYTVLEGGENVLERDGLYYGIKKGTVTFCKTVQLSQANSQRFPKYNYVSNVFTVEITSDIRKLDMDMNGKLQLNDAMTILSSVALKSKLDELGGYIADADNSGDVSLNDAMTAVMIVAKKMPEIW